MVKILIIGVDKRFNAEYFYRNAFTDIGNDVLLLNEYEGVRHEFLLRILSTRTSAARFMLNILPINKTAPDLARRFNPDVIIIFKGELISTTTLTELAKEFRTCLFYPDMLKFKPLLKRRLEYFDVVFTAANIIKPYYDMGARHVVTVPWACEPTFHRKLELEKSYSVSFVGTRYRERAKILKSIPSTEIFGDFWRRSDGKIHKKVIGEEYVEVMNRTKINLNLQAKDNLVVDAPTMRTFEIAGSGNFQLTNEMPSIRRYFPDMPTFRTASELRELIGYFLQNEEERKEIAEDCMRICREKFTYTKAAEYMLKTL